MFKPIVLTEENDKTGALKKVEILKKIIESKSEFLAEENVIALYGGWGSGKSSVIKTLMDGSEEHKLSSDFKMIHFEAWEYERDNRMSLSLFEMMLDFKIEQDKSWKKGKEKDIKSLKKFFASVKGGIKGTTISLAPFGVGAEINLEKVCEELDKIEEEYIKRSHYSEKKEVKKKYKELTEEIINADEKLVVFIDDLDRCENENVLEIITSLKHIFSEASNIMFVVAIDRDAVSQALKVKYGDNTDKAEEYLEKVFPVNLSLQHEAKLELYLKEFEGLNDEMSYSLLRKYGVVNPRKLNKVINKLKLALMIEKPINSAKNTYFNKVLLFILVLSEYNTEHLKRFYKKCEGKNEVLFAVDMATQEELEVSAMGTKDGKPNKSGIEINKNPYYFLTHTSQLENKSFIEIAQRIRKII